MGGKVTRQSPEATTFEEEGERKPGIKTTSSTCLPIVLLTAFSGWIAVYAEGGNVYFQICSLELLSPVFSGFVRVDTKYGKHTECVLHPIKTRT